MATIGSLAVNIVAKTEKFTKGISKALSQTERFSKGILSGTKIVGKYTAGLAAAGTAGFLALANSQRGALDLIGKTSDKLGIQTERLIGLSHAAEQTGVSQGTLFMAMQRSSRRIAEASKGTGEAVKALEELGLSATKLNSLSPDRQIGLIADAMNKVEGQSDKVRLAMKLFDSEGVALVNTLKLGSDGLAKMDREARQLGGAFSREEVAKVEALNDQLDRLGKVTKAMAGKFLIDVAPTALKWAKDLTDAVQGLKHFNLPGAEKKEGMMHDLQQVNAKQYDRIARFYERNFFADNSGGALTKDQQAKSDARIAKSFSMTDSQNAAMDRQLAAEDKNKDFNAKVGEQAKDAIRKFGKMFGSATNEIPGIKNQVTKGVDKLFDKMSAQVKLATEGSSFMESFKTPIERIAERLDQAKGLLSSGAISQSQYQKAVASIENEGNTLAKKGQTQFSGAALRGSAEARSAILRAGRDNPMVKIAKTNQDQLKVQREQLEEQKKANSGGGRTKEFEGAIG